MPVGGVGYGGNIQQPATKAVPQQEKKQDLAPKNQPVLAPKAEKPIQARAVDIRV
tara:strand:+ start:267 stop:431 length:165 start_codon:yes stop_codon:yes gene_type:complete